MGSSSNEKFCLRWNDFESNISVAFRDIREDKEFFDCTLSCGSRQIQAHKLILSACSPFFRSVFKQNPHQHPLLYLKGVEFVNLQSVLSFMYHGEVNVAQEELNSFLSVAEDLEVKGLTQNHSPNNSKNNSKQEPASHKKTVFETSSSPLPPPEHQRHTVVTAQSDPLFDVQTQDDIQEIIPPTIVKTEPLQVPVSRVEEGMEIANMDQNYDNEGFNNYEVYDDQTYYQEDGTQGYDGYGEAGAGEQNKGINNFVIKTDAGFTCAECGKEFSDQSNCRRHVKNYHNKSSISSLICNLCHKTYKNHDSLRHHQRATHNLYKAVNSYL